MTSVLGRLPEGVNSDERFKEMMEDERLMSGQSPAAERGLMM